MKRVRERVYEGEAEGKGEWVGVPLKAPSGAHGLIQYVAQSVGNCRVLDQVFSQVS